MDGFLGLLIGLLCGGLLGAAIGAAAVDEDFRKAEQRHCEQYGGVVGGKSAEYHRGVGCIVMMPDGNAKILPEPK